MRRRRKSGRPVKWLEIFAILIYHYCWEALWHQKPLFQLLFYQIHITRFTLGCWTQELGFYNIPEFICKLLITPSFPCVYFCKNCYKMGWGQGWGVTCGGQRDMGKVDGSREHRVMAKNCNSNLRPTWFSGLWAGRRKVTSVI